MKFGGPCMMWLWNFYLLTVKEERIKGLITSHFLHGAGEMTLPYTLRAASLHALMPTDISLPLLFFIEWVGVTKFLLRFLMDIYSIRWLCTRVTCNILALFFCRRRLSISITSIQTVHRRPEIHIRTRHFTAYICHLDLLGVNNAVGHHRLLP